MSGRQKKISRIAGAVIVGAGLTLGASVTAQAEGARIQTWEQVAQLSADETTGYAVAIVAATPEAVAAFVAAHPTSPLVAQLLAAVPAAVAGAAIQSLPVSVMAQVDIAGIAAAAPAVAARVAAAQSFATGSISTTQPSARADVSYGRDSVSSRVSLAEAGGY